MNFISILQISKFFKFQKWLEEEKKLSTHFWIFYQEFFYSFFGKIESIFFFCMFYFQKCLLGMWIIMAGKQIKLTSKTFFSLIIYKIFFSLKYVQQEYKENIFPCAYLLRRINKNIKIEEIFLYCYQN